MRAFFLAIIMPLVVSCEQKIVRKKPAMTTEQIEDIALCEQMIRELEAEPLAVNPKSLKRIKKRDQIYSAERTDYIASRH